jgi:hypothetical protein
MSQQSSNPGGLPEPWVDRIFDKLTLVYGQSFLRRWADIDLAAVKADWAHELAWYAQQPSAIAWALQNLPAEKPPTVIEFRALARKAPAPVVPKLEGPKADPDRVAAEMAKLAPVIEKPRADPKRWARVIVERADAGEKVTPVALRFAREALGMQR